MTFFTCLLIKTSLNGGLFAASYARTLCPTGEQSQKLNQKTLSSVPVHFCPVRPMAPVSAGKDQFVFPQKNKSL
ncbi:hypothetical protein QQ054_19305 [Oscillatoria amoena NRMC-F 0135]|nr:hypothetical protein [Oscillatoria laete-virens]MDL5048166.1 hypothetical protein [Oscillatoria amoena NRMC-F 0135]MDL5053058.1 hypothetical protein [Oscillatoria laete-virens NRMC-F 0139]